MPNIIFIQHAHNFHAGGIKTFSYKFIFWPRIRFFLQLPQSYFDRNRIVETDHPLPENGLKIVLCFSDNTLMKIQMQKKKKNWILSAPKTIISIREIMQPRS